MVAAGGGRPGVGSAVPAGTLVKGTKSDFSTKIYFSIEPYKTPKYVWLRPNLLPPGGAYALTQAP